MIKRKKYLDFMKFIGLCCLFFAHVQGPYLLEEIRGFDVPMLVIISGILSISSIEKANSTKKYVIKRIKRLVIPTWIFLSIFYIAMLIMGQKPNPMDVVKSYLFQRDCGLAGGVWIIWVYLICAVLGPVLYKLITKKWFVPILVILVALNDGLIYLSPLLIENRLLYYSIFTIVPYGSMLALGMYLPNMNNNSKRILVSFSLILYVAIATFLFFQNGEYVSISQYKYPARIYYLSYGLCITIILLEITRYVENKLPNIKIIKFISENSLWIYLWQIMILTIVNYVLRINQYWILSWICLMFGSVFVTMIQFNYSNWLEKKTNMKFWRYFRG